MKQKRDTRLRAGPPIARMVLVWLVLVALSLAALAVFERNQSVSELSTKTAVLHRLASQRADQHDAHLTSLSAIFVAGGAERQDLFLDVAATIMRFYPRIVSVGLVPFDPQGEDIRTNNLMSAEDEAVVRKAAQTTSGTLQVLGSPQFADHYLLVKRSPNTEVARHGLALMVDAAALIETDDPFWQNPSVSRWLTLPDGTVILRAEEQRGIVKSKPLGSRSQPLLLETSLSIRLADLLPLMRSLIVIVLVSAVFILILLGLRQRARTLEAERRAQLSAQETRLAHASRVNAMGEMASGMAHELAQPLTAILSQSQAGRHLAKRGDIGKLAQVLDDTVTQAQRASDILDRLRRWSKPTPEAAITCSLNRAAQNVARLLEGEARSLGAKVALEPAAEDVTVNAEPIELEQVIFNLVRNALEASENAKVVVRTAVLDGTAILDVIDDGPGIPVALQSRIYEPFVTGKPDGTGLGLALCQRIVEQMGGDIALLPDVPRTTFRVSLPQAHQKDLG